MQLLTDAEQRCASIPDLQQQIADLELRLADARRQLDVARDQARQLDDRLMDSERALREVFRSPSWQLTKPLRYAQRRLERR